MTSLHLTCVLSVLCIITSACLAASAKPFNSQEWIRGTPSARGQMVQDLSDRKMLINKSKTEVEALLGKPDGQHLAMWEYNVVTIPRCYFWDCRMEVSFDENTGKVEGIAVSD